MDGELWISVDYGHFEKTVLMDVKLQGLYLGKVNVGGLGGPSSAIPFIGCIKVKDSFHFIIRYSIT